MDGPVERVALTPAAAELLRAPMWYPAGDLIVGAADMFLGELDISTSVDSFEPIPVYISTPQFQYCRTPT